MSNPAQENHGLLLGEPTHIVQFGPANNDVFGYIIVSPLWARSGLEAQKVAQAYADKHKHRVIVISLNERGT